MVIFYYFFFKFISFTRHAKRHAHKSKRVLGNCDSCRVGKWTFPLLFPACFSTQENILSEASKDKKAARATLKGEGVSLHSAQETLTLQIFRLSWKLMSQASPSWLFGSGWLRLWGNQKTTRTRRVAFLFQFQFPKNCQRDVSVWNL